MVTHNNWLRTNIKERSNNKKSNLEDVFREDVIAIEKQKEKYFPLKISSNKYEDHCVHFGQWVMKNKE